MYKHLMRQVCDVEELDQDEGCHIPVVRQLPCTFPFPHNYRQNRAETVYDFQPLMLFTHVPEGVEIRENMRVVFDRTSTGERPDFRIHSVSKWPLVNPEYIQLTLQGEGHGY